MTADVRAAREPDAETLHQLAAATFALACPPGTIKASIDDHVARHLSAASFSAYLADQARMLLIAETDGVPAGYTMLIFGEPTDPDIVRAISLRPTVELSKCYVLADHHGTGVASALMTATMVAAKDRGAAGAWLGVNQSNPRANRFYEKSGFVIVGTRRFLLGDRWEDDLVRERAL